jgi:hypothetical protein
VVTACGSPQPEIRLDVSGIGNASETFAATGKHGWNVEWSYDCSKTGGSGIFVVDVFNAHRTPDFVHPGISEEGDRDSGVYHVPESGRFYLDVTTTCAWTLKVIDLP